MKISFWPQDSIASRLGLMLGMSMLATGLLVGLFFVFGGVWAQPPMNAAARLRTAVGTVCLFEATPPHLRNEIAEKLRNKINFASWFNNDTPVSDAFQKEYERQRSLPENDRKRYTPDVEQFSNDIQRIAYTLNLDDLPAVDRDSPLHSAMNLASYNLVVKLNDGSWLVLSGVGRTWGLSYGQRFSVWMAVSIGSFVLITVFMARRCARPYERIAQAIRQSGIIPLSPPIPLHGPRELDIIIHAFNELQKQIQDLVDTRTFMLAAISHDLRTPLTRIRLRSDYIVDRVQRAKLRADVDEMQTMIDSALSFFRGDTAGEPARPFDLAGILQSIVDDYEDRSIKVVYAGPGDMTYVGRPLALKRAFTNLIENAVKYASPPTVALVSQAEGLAVTIRDHGPGIPDEEMDKVFKPYFRLDKSRNLTTGGIGLGLTIAQTIVRRHGGDITLRNHPSGGLEATVLLPWPPDVDGS